MNPLRGDAPALSAAANWRLRHAAGLTPAAQAEFDAWLAADPQHAAAWREVGATLMALDRIRAAGQAEDLVRELALRRRRRWRRRAIAGSVLALAACAVVLVALSPKPAAPAAAEASAAPVIVRASERRLEDGTRVVLNTDTAIAVSYSATRREVRLQQGEALFMVESDPARPFVVVTGQIEVRAVGTAFAVHAGVQAVAVLVTEGRVSVTPAANRPSQLPAAGAAVPVLVEAGRQLSVSPGLPAWDETVQPERLSATEIDRRLAWREPRMELAGTSLAEAVAVLNRENSLQIVIADPNLSRLRLTGVYRLDDATGFVHVLETYFGVTAARNADGNMVIRQR